MRRRDFILGLAATALWPLSARAQDSAKKWLIGFISHGYEKMYDPLFDAMRELGYVEGRNIVIERRYAEGRAERFERFAQEMVQLKADLIIVTTTPAALAAEKATKTIPILIPHAIDPVGAGLVATLAHPGGNLTGGTLMQAELSVKRLQMLKEAVPGLSHVALLWNAGNQAYAHAWEETQEAAHSLGLTIEAREVRTPADLPRVFAAMTQEHPDALLILEDALTIQHRREIAEFALRNRLPTSFLGKEAVEAGGLMSYGPSWPSAFRRAANYVDRILKGAKPADLPVQQATTFELAINLKTAKALGLTFPPSFHLRADEVIE